MFILQQPHNDESNTFWLFSRVVSWLRLTVRFDQIHQSQQLASHGPVWLTNDKESLAVGLETDAGEQTVLSSQETR